MLLMLFIGTFSDYELINMQKGRISVILEEKALLAAGN